MWVADGLFYLGFNWVPSKWDQMGFMRATQMWVCIGYASVGPTRALCALLNWICNGFLTRAPHWLSMWEWSWSLYFIRVKILVLNYSFEVYNASFLAFS